MARVLCVVCPSFTEAPTKNGNNFAGKKKGNLQKEIAQFKKDLKQVTVFCCEVENEWMFQTCKSPQNRLLPCAIVNKHAGIRGMPAINEDEAKEIAKMVLRLKGVSSRTQLEALKEGRLKIPRKKLTYKSIFEKRISAA